jgi:EAL domain-containing protein (putative c-di-GMP-specific phosphodiesterase class I)/GAF domain-containing protein/GGDEF domain-containing protein
MGVRVGDRGKGDLTGLPGHVALARDGGVALARLLGGGGRAAVMVVELDHVREVGIALGYDAADALVAAFAQRLGAVDPRPVCVVRITREEFALLLPLAGAGPGPGEVGKAVLDQIAGRLRICGMDLDVEATAGLAEAASRQNGDGQNGAQDIATLLGRADAALSEARRAGQRLGVWSDSVARAQTWEWELVTQLRSAIRGGELVLYYQPMREAATGRTAAVEALVRWRHPVRGLLPPAAFLPMTERSSLIVDLTWWVLDEALRQNARWRERGLSVGVSVNVSPRVLTDDSLPRVIDERLAVHGLDPDVLTLELTEDALVPQPARAAAMLARLRVRGVRLSLDDFGTGYNSIEILKALPFDEIKIDRGFVTGAQDSIPSIAIVQSVIDLGHRLGLRVVGEGIEDERSERMLTEFGCDLLQGVGLSPPVPADELTELLTRPASGASAPPGVVPAPAARRPRSVHATDSPTPGASCHNGAAHNDATRSDAAHAGTLRGMSLPGRRVPEPPDERDRHAALCAYRILDSAPEPAFDTIAALAAHVTGCARARIVLVDAHREWSKAGYGPEADEPAERVGLASHAVGANDDLEVADAAADPRFSHIVDADPTRSTRFLAAVPLRTPRGHAVGALCVAHGRPRRLAPRERDALRALADHTMEVLEARRQRLIGEDIALALSTLEQLWRPQDLATAATLTADVVRSITGADAVGVMLADLPGAAVFHAAGSSLTPGTKPLTRFGIPITPEDHTALREMGKLRDPLFVADPENSPLIPMENVRGLNIRSALVLPLPDAGGRLGVITVRWTRPVREPEPSVMRAATLFAAAARHSLLRLHRLHTQRAHEPSADAQPNGTSRR